MNSFERLRARIAVIRGRIDAGKPSRLPSWRNKPKVPPTGGGETRSRAPVGVVPAKPPDAPGRVPTLLSPAPGVQSFFRGSCKARCALTGKVCALPAHGKERKHRCGPWEFHLVAVEGQTYFPRANEIDGYAVRREAADVL